MPRARKKQTIGNRRSGTVDEILRAIRVENPDDKEWPQDYASQATSSFLDEWISNNVDPEMQDPQTVRDTIEPNVQDAIWEAVSKSVWSNTMLAATNAIERSAERAGVQLSVDSNDKGVVTIEFEPKSMMRAWAEETEGMGYTAWDPSLRPKDIESAIMIVNILQHRDEVYGGGSMERDFESYFERFEPEIGHYFNLSKIAEKALRR